MEKRDEKETKISGLQVMGVFTLCGFLASLGSGGVTSVLVVTARVWPTEGPAHSEDASTSMSELRPKEGEARP